MKEEKKLYYLLKVNDYIAAKNIAPILELSEKTIRKIIKDINMDLKKYDAEIESKPRYGYKLVINNEAKILEYENKFNKASSTPNSPNERIEYLINLLLNTSDYIKIENIADSIYTTSKTISNDLKKIEKILSEYNLEIDRKPYYGIKVEGPEFYKRICLGDYFEQRINNNWGDDPDRDKELEEIGNILLSYINFHEYSISDIALQNLVVILYISIKRIKNNYDIKFEGIDLKNLNINNYLESVQILLSEFEKLYQVKFLENEVKHIAIHLVSKMNTDSIKMAGTSFKKEVNMEIENIVEEMIKVIRLNFKYDFRFDENLHERLYQHLKPLKTRIRFGMKIKNPLLQDIKENLKIPYAMAMYASAIIYNFYNRHISEDEVSFLAVIFALALEKIKKDVNKKNVLIICPSGQGSSQFLLYRYKELFGEYLNDVTTCSINEINPEKLENIDAIFTTVNLDALKLKIDIPLYKVDYFLKSENIDEVKKIFENTKNEIMDFYDKKLFIPDLNLNNKDEIINYMVNHVSKYRDLPSNFLDSVFEREKLGFTEFGNMVAMPHTMESLTKETFISVAILRNPIIWDNKEIQIVFLLSIAKNSGNSLDEFYRKTTKFLFEENNIKQLIKNRSYEYFIKTLEEA